MGHEHEPEFPSVARRVIVTEWLPPDHRERQACRSNVMRARPSDQFFVYCRERRFIFDIWILSTRPTRSSYPSLCSNGFLYRHAAPRWADPSSGGHETHYVALERAHEQKIDSVGREPSLE